MSRKSEKEKKRSSHGDSSDSDDGEIDGMRIAADQLTLSPRFLEKVPKNIREWATKDTQAWLREIFEGSEDLESYVAQFGKFGIRGIDLLSTTEKQLVDFGISHSIHINRAKTSISQLIVYQQALDKKLKKEQKLREKEKPYYDLLDEATSLRAKSPPYQSPYSIKYWKAVDVFMWLEAKENIGQLGLFVKPFSLERISGKELLEMVNKPDEHFHEICRTLKQGLTPVDIQRLKDAITNKKKYYEELNKKIKETKLKEMDKSVQKIEKMKQSIKNLSVLGTGNFGIIYSAILKNQRVVLKRVKMKPIADTTDEGTDPSGKPTENQIKLAKEEIEKHRVKEEQHQKLLNFKEEALLREAFMMAKCAGKGVVRLIGQGEVKGTRLIAMEFMSGHSVEQEIIRASKDDGSDSIFHPQHKDNIDLVNRVGVDDPVLYQILRIGRDVASALARIHSLGVIHLDIAARNILLDRDKRPKVTDFGMARLESDMIEQSSYRAALIDEAAAKNMGQVERDVYLKWDHKDRRNADLDETEEDLILEIFEGQVPIPWMPIWTLIDKKVVDRHWDVYAFGCFLYEMAMRQPPFQGASHKDMVDLKQSLDTHPKLSTVDFPSEFIDIVNLAWSDYEHQPLMPALYDRITALHKSVVSGSSSISVIDEYLAMKENLGIPNQATSESIYSDAIPVTLPAISGNISPASSPYARPSYTSTSPYGRSSSTSAYGRPSSASPRGGGYAAPSAVFPAPNPIVSNLYSAPQSSAGYSQANALTPSTPTPTTESSAPVPPLLHKFMIPKRVRLTIDPNDLEGPKDMDKFRLEEMLDCALSSQDYIFILEIMNKIPVNNDELQIDIISKCFDLLKSFAENSHMGSNNDDVWKHIIERICLKLSQANQIPAEIGTLDRLHLLRLTIDGTAAIASLLRGKHWNDDKDLPSTMISQSSINSQQLKYLCTMLSFNLKTFVEESAEIARYTCMAISMLASDSDSIRDQFHRDGALQSIIGVLNHHVSDAAAVKEAFTALGSFYLSQILLAVPLPPPARNQAPIDPKVIIDSWKLYSSAFFDCLRHYLLPEATPVVPAAPANSNEEESKDSNESVVQVILSVMLDICNNGIEAFDELEKLFVNMTGDDLRLLADAVQRYPKNFRIQEGGFGVISAILQTGHETPIIRIAANTDPTIVTFVLPHAERVSIFVEKPENLDNLLTAMETFSVDDKIAIGIRKEKEVNKQQEEYYSRGLYFTGTMSQSSKKKALTSTNAYGASGVGYGAYGTNNNYYLNDSTRKNNNNSNNSSQLNQMGRDLLLEEFEKTELHFDEEGKHISAAILQKSAAVIIGITSASYPKDVPARLYRTRYNELILQALKNFKNDVNLTHYAFIALYYTCRKNTMHQVFLHELAITKHLYAALLRFQYVCDEMPDSLVLILEGVTGGLVGLLEPQDDQTGTENPINFNILTKTAALALEKEMNNITINKELPSFKYCRELSEYLIRDDKIKYTELEKLGSILLKLRNPLEVNIQLGNNEDYHDWHSVYVMYFKLIGTLLFWSPNVLKERWSDLFLSSYQRDDHGDVTIGENQYILLKLGIFPFVLRILKSFHLSTMNHSNTSQSLHPNVLAAALSLLTSISRLIVGDRVLFGEESSYISIFNNGVENVQAREELLSYCLLSSKEQYHHPILIRYSLWMMIYLIAGKSVETTTTTAVDEKKVQLESNRDVAAEIALSNGIEWAIEAMKAFPDYYTIQCLAILFLIWMEKRGHFAKRKLSLVSLKELLQRIMDNNVTGGTTQQYKTLEEEGHDTSLIGRSIYMFGDILAHADRLLRLIDSHLVEKQQIIHDTWDGITRPIRIEAIRFEKEEDESGRIVDVFILEITWENRFDATTHSYQPFTWRVKKRHATFARFQQDLLRQFPSLPPLFSELAVVPNFGRIVKLLFSRSPEFLEKRRTLMNKSFLELNKVRATLFNPIVLSYLEVDKNIKEMRSGHSLASIPIRPNPSAIASNKELPINDIKIDEEEGLVFVATGLPYSIFQNTSAQLRGFVSIYRIIYEELRGDSKPGALPPYQLQEITKVGFTFGVQTVAWDRTRRCVAVGFSMGLISYYSFVSGNSLAYVGEQDYHTDVITDMKFVTRERKLFLEYEIQMLLVAVSQGSRVTIVDMKDGGVICQVAKAFNGAKLVSSAVDVMDSILILGTEQGSVLAYDITATTPQHIATLVFNHATTTNPKDPGIPLNNKGSVYVALANAQRLVYAAHHNKIFICKLAVRAETANRLVLWKTLHLAQGIQITAIKLIHYDQRLVVTCSNGSVVIYDMSEQPLVARAVVAQTTSQVAGAILAVTAMVQEAKHQDPTAGGSKGVVLASGHDASAKLHNEYATSAANLLPWNEVVKLKESALRDWLRGKGEVASKIYSRSGLLLAVMEKAGQPLSALADAVRPVNPYADVLFAYRFGSNKEKSPFPVMKSIVMMEAYQTLLLGGNDGFISRYSLLDFYPPYHGSDVNNQQKANAIAGGDLLGIFTTTKTTKTTKYQSS